MANNRLYIRCNVCGKALFLGKCFGEGYYWTNYKKDGEHLEDKLNEFFDKHKYCDEEITKSTEYDTEEFRIPGKSLYSKEGDFSIAYECSEIYENEALNEIIKMIEQSRERTFSGLLDKNNKYIRKGDTIRGLFLFGMPINGVCDFKNGAFGVKWMRGEVEEFTPFCCTHNIDWEVVCDDES